ncbi:MAG: exopolysaccharide biosynthesis protein [Allosphingosinicella sp.]|uniref:exopolysaccharide biosynthesis protein n=1 Tax=Allosphingosinicella sp. TaxID=2823234 RepID=UPI003923C531
MNKESAIRQPASLLERAAEIYDFSAALRAAAPAAEPSAQPAPEPARAPQAAERPRPEPAFRRARPAGPVQPVDRAALAEAGFILPDAPVTGLAEEYRIVKRELLAALARTDLPEERRRAVMVCSANPDEGKTFSALNLALSLAGEKDVEVLLVDGDFNKPELLSILGLEGETGLVDALADPALDPERAVIRTDIPGLSVLPAGRAANNVPELLGSARTREVLGRLAAADPRRILLFDSPPTLMASPASVLAAHVGQVVLVVRADRTVEADLREAVRLLSACPNLSLLLNGAGFAATGRRFGSYYGYGQ